MRRTRDHPDLHPLHHRPTTWQRGRDGDRQRAGRAGTNESVGRDIALEISPRAAEPDRGSGHLVAFRVQRARAQPHGVAGTHAPALGQDLQRGNSRFRGSNRRLRAKNQGAEQQHCSNNRRTRHAAFLKQRARTVETEVSSKLKATVSTPRQSLRPARAQQLSWNRPTVPTNCLFSFRPSSRIPVGGVGARCAAQPLVSASRRRCWRWCWCWPWSCLRCCRPPGS